MASSMSLDAAENKIDTILTYMTKNPIEEVVKKFLAKNERSRTNKIQFVDSETGKAIESADNYARKRRRINEVKNN